MRSLWSCPPLYLLIWFYWNYGTFRSYHQGPNTFKHIGALDSPAGNCMLFWSYHSYWASRCVPPATPNNLQKPWDSGLTCGNLRRSLDLFDLLDVFGFPTSKAQTTATDWNIVFSHWTSGCTLDSVGIIGLPEVFNHQGPNENIQQHWSMGRSYGASQTQFDVMFPPSKPNNIQTHLNIVYPSDKFEFHW